MSIFAQNRIKFTQNSLKVCLASSNMGGIAIVTALLATGTALLAIVTALLAIGTALLAIVSALLAIVSALLAIVTALLANALCGCTWALTQLYVWRYVDLARFLTMPFPQLHVWAYRGLACW